MTHKDRSAALRERPGSGPAEHLLHDLRADVGAATSDIRCVVYDLRPPMLDQFGLVGALRNLQVTHTGLTQSIEAPDPLPPLSAAVEVALYRIAAEVLHNIVRHAEVDHCVVQLDVSDTTITLAAVVVSQMRRLRHSLSSVRKRYGTT